MAVKIQEKLDEMTVYKCPECGGSGEEIKDWYAYNQLGTPTGFSRKAAERQRQYSRQAYGACSRCAGKGFLFKSKS